MPALIRGIRAILMAISPIFSGNDQSLYIVFVLKRQNSIL